MNQGERIEYLQSGVGRYLEEESTQARQVIERAQTNIARHRHGRWCWLWCRERRAEKKIAELEAKLLQLSIWKKAIESGAPREMLLALEGIINEHLNVSPWEVVDGILALREHCRLSIQQEDDDHWYGW